VIRADIPGGSSNPRQRAPDGTLCSEWVAYPAMWDQWARRNWFLVFRLASVDHATTYHTDVNPAASGYHPDAPDVNRVAMMTRQADEVTGSSSTRPAAPALARSRPRTIPEATVGRLAVYLRVLSDRSVAHGIVSSAELAAAAGVNPAGLRRDLSFLGTHGVRGVGYDVDTLIEQIRRVLGAHHQFRVALVGIGNLGQALAGYAGFSGRGFGIGALFDVDPQKIGRVVSGLPVLPVLDVAEVCAREGITIGVIATPEAGAQSAADVLVAAGIFSILNFAAGKVSVPAGVEVRRVDLALELQMLAFHETSRVDGALDSVVAR
jgi:redox-sensing transcriptional repressor